MRSTRLTLGSDWRELADIVASAEMLGEHIRCGLAVPERLARLRQRLAWSVNRTQVEIVTRYLVNKGVEREDINRLRLSVCAPGPVRRPGDSPDRESDDGDVGSPRLRERRVV